jgi:uncharacterized protein (TIGR02569 family)
MAETNTSLVPPHTVFAAFGASETPERLAGGRGLTWRSGQVVIRPTADPEEASWKCDVLAELDEAEGFTVPRPIRDNQGNWVHDGWQAIEWIPGTADETRVRDVVRAGQAFHRAIAGLPRPSFITASSNAWSNADRMTWSEMSLPADELLQLLAAEYRPVFAPSQVIHGDLLGNVLFAEGRPPALIDWAPWRPTVQSPAVLPTVEFGGVNQPRNILFRVDRSTSPFKNFRSEGIDPKPHSSKPEEFLEDWCPELPVSDWLNLADLFLKEVEARKAAAADRG